MISQVDMFVITFYEIIENVFSENSSKIALTASHLRFLKKFLCSRVWVPAPLERCENAPWCKTNR